MVIVCLIAGLFCLVMGYMIRSGGSMWMISEYREGKVADEKGMARWTGMCMYVIAGACWLIGFLFYAVPEHPLAITLGFYFVMLHVMIIVLAGSQRFMKNGYRKKTGRYGRRY